MRRELETTAISERRRSRRGAAPPRRLPASVALLVAAEPLPEAETLEYRACTADEDCTYALNGCCECVEGGEYIGVRKDQADEFRHRFSCITAECPEPIDDLPCGTVIAACRDGLCVHSVLTPP